MPEMVTREIEAGTLEVVDMVPEKIQPILQDNRLHQATYQLVSCATSMDTLSLTISTDLMSVLLHLQ